MRNVMDITESLESLYDQLQTSALEQELARVAEAHVLACEDYNGDAQASILNRSTGSLSTRLQGKITEHRTGRLVHQTMLSMVLIVHELRERRQCEKKERDAALDPLVCK